MPGTPQSGHYCGRVEFFGAALAFLVGFGSLAVVAWAFVDAFGFSKEEFADADRLPRMLWLVMLAFGFGLLLWLGAGFIVREPLGMRSIAWIAVMMSAGVYFYDQRPKLLNARAARGYGR